MSLILCLRLNLLVVSRMKATLHIIIRSSISSSRSSIISIIIISINISSIIACVIALTFNVEKERIKTLRIFINISIS